MKPRKSKEIISSLQRKGFRQRTTHHLFQHFYIDGTATEIYTYISPGIEYGDILLSQVKKQLRFQNTKQLENFLDCPMSKEDYINILKEEGIL